MSHKADLLCYVYGAFSGFLAALGAFIGKVAFSEFVPSLLLWLKNLPRDYHESTSGDQQFSLFHLPSLASSHSLHILIARGIFLLLMVINNTIMWGIFAKALKSSDSTTEITIINIAFNIIVSSLLGLFFFGEMLNKLWFVGLVLTLTGLSVVVAEKVRLSTAHEEKKNR